jgi:uncharacterized protein GlcG (DUF336 family)
LAWNRSKNILHQTKENFMRRSVYLGLSILALTVLSALPAKAAPSNACAKLPGHEALQKALKDARGQNNGGLSNDMWGSIVDRSGVVCAVAYTGESVGAQWPGSRLISATKANTANAFSLDGMALSTANLYAGTQPGGFLFGIQASHPVNPAVAYKGPASAFGSAKDPMVGEVLGGATVFGGGLALYDEKGKIVGGLGVSGDTACADHNIAWRTRHDLKLDYVAKGVSSDKNDQIIYDIKSGKSAGGFGHPVCGAKEDDVLKDLPATSAVAEAKPEAAKK